MPRTEYTVTQLAALLGLSPTTVRWHCREETGVLHNYVRTVDMGPQSMWLIPEHAAKKLAARFNREWPS